VYGGSPVRSPSPSGLGQTDYSPISPTNTEIPSTPFMTPLELLILPGVAVLTGVTVTVTEAEAKEKERAEEVEAEAEEVEAEAKEVEAEAETEKVEAERRRKSSRSKHRSRSRSRKSRSRDRDGKRSSGEKDQELVTTQRKKDAAKIQKGGTGAKADSGNATAPTGRQRYRQPSCSQATHHHHRKTTAAKDWQRLCLGS